jgi:predicted DNA-binding ribbon-helix-helix protein
LSAVKKRSVSINGHRTSYSIEDEFQAALNTIAMLRELPLARLISEIDAVPRQEGGLSSAIRVFVLKNILKTKSTAEPAAQSPAP